MEARAIRMELKVLSATVKPNTLALIVIKYNKMIIILTK